MRNLAGFERARCGVADTSAIGTGASGKAFWQFATDSTMLVAIPSVMMRQVLRTMRRMRPPGQRHLVDYT
jgi:hypothetical protein